jgi:hypothetical protein
MKNLLKVMRAGLGFGIAPLVLVGLGGGTFLGLTVLTEGGLDKAPFRLETLVALLGILAMFAVALALAGVAFALSLGLAKRIGGRMPDGALAVVMGTLFGVVFAAALVMLRDPLGRVACGYGHWISGAICEMNTAIGTQLEFADLWRMLSLMLVGYGGISGLVIGGTVAETRGIKVVSPVKQEAAPQHLNKRYRTREEILAKVRAEEAAQSVADAAPAGTAPAQSPPRNPVTQR